MEKTRFDAPVNGTKPQPAEQPNAFSAVDPTTKTAVAIREMTDAQLHEFIIRVGSDLRVANNQLQNALNHVVGISEFKAAIEYEQHRRRHLGLLKPNYLG